MNSNTTKKYLFRIIATIAIFVLGYKTGVLLNTQKLIPVEQVEGKGNNASKITIPTNNASFEKEVDHEEKLNTVSNASGESIIPHKVFTVLKHIREFNEAPDGYVGGRTFQNREGILPKKDDENHKIKYQEWDVNPKIAGQNRGPERLVTSPDDAYYTKDHYKTFTKIDE